MPTVSLVGRVDAPARPGYLAFHALREGEPCVALLPRQAGHLMTIALDDGTGPLEVEVPEEDVL